MWVVNSSGDKTVNCYLFKIDRIYGEKAGKYAILGEYAHNFWGGVYEVISVHKTKEDAINELEKLNKSLEKGVKIYRF